MRRSLPLLTLGLLAALSLPAQDHAELRAPTADAPWAYARSVFRTYSNNSRTNPPAAGFSQIMVENVERGYPGRQEAGGWAGEFVRDSFLVAAHDIASNPRFWQAPVTQEDLASAQDAASPLCAFLKSFGLASRETWYAELLGLLALLGLVEEQGLGEQVIRDIAMQFAARHHFRRHLQPAFQYVIRKQLLAAAAVPPAPLPMAGHPVNQVARAIHRLNTEHETHLRKALQPAMTASTQLSSLLRWLGRSAPFASAPDQARALRRQIMRATVDEIRRQGYATSDDVLYLRNVIDGQSPH
ncbi:MAG: hypothetical protein INH43_26130 [Acidobacteriaceae bacterium]|nr:hypothetical protein [Acidobacteriaceae bacterium]